MPSTMEAVLEEISAAWKEVPLIVMIFIGSEDCTVRIALPA